MHSLVSKWLNGNQEYHTGVALAKICKADAELCSFLNKGPNDLSRKKLKEWLMQYCERTKTNDHGTDSSTLDNGFSRNQQEKRPERNPDRTTDAKETITTQADYSQTTLYLACKKQADDLYKQMMNKRAVMFAGVDSLLPHEDANRPDLLANREKDCLELVIMSQKVSKLYDRADYVLLHGKLPYTEAEELETNLDGIPDLQVKPMLDNLRKSLSKLRKRVQTPERIELIRVNTEKLNRLEARWQLLKIEQ